MIEGAMRVEDVSGNFWLVIGLIGIEPVSSHYRATSTVQKDQAAQSIFELLQSLEFLIELNDRKDGNDNELNFI
jgi:hypothetical protein